ncbi:zinc finger protein ZAT6-like [Henckelia pumila]|uniref:zinc finger protein ZAT6-like n=1 Tax=Henckelia pumila TaxID=405737 RepID=UPI003C6E91F3
MSVLSNPPPHSGDQNFEIKHEGNEHSYFLRAKTNRLMCYKASEDDFKMSSSDKDREEEDLANCLVMLSSNKSFAFSSDGKDENKAKEILEINATFQCKSCKKVFSSHQALGGHRASHKRVKGCFASNSDPENVDQDSIQEDCEFLTTQSETTTVAPPTSNASAKKTLKMHECTICRRVFSSGQALGGHKRCHWLTSISSDNSFNIPNLHDFEYGHDQQVYKASNDHIIDLNLKLPVPQLGRRNDADITKCEGQRIKAMDSRNEEESCTERKLRKLSELGDVKLDRWLQVGIASFTY